MESEYWYGLIVVAVILLWTHAFSLAHCVALIVLFRAYQNLMEFIMHEWKLMGRAKEDTDHFSIEHYIFFRIDCLYSRHRTFKGYLLLASTIVLIIVGLSLIHI